MADGFLGRWSRRKLDVKEGKPVEEPAEKAIHDTATIRDRAAGSPGQPPGPVSTDPGQRPDDGAGEPAPVLPTLEDVKALTHHGDFKPYMAQGVAPEVKNAAMKKLFADPHFNIMDGLDTYIDDYSKPDPMPTGMLRQMVGSKLLGLFDNEGKEAPARANAGDVADAPAGQSVAQSYANPDIPAPEATVTKSQPDALPEAVREARASQEHDAHTDLRLQPDNAAPASGAGRGPQ